MIGKEDNKRFLNVVFSALSFLLAPLPCYCSGVPDYPCLYDQRRKDYKDKNVVGNAWASVAREHALNFFSHQNNVSEIRELSTLNSFKKQLKTYLKG